MKPGEVHQGRVFGTAAWGIYLDVEGVHVLVHVSDRVHSVVHIFR